MLDKLPAELRHLTLMVIVAIGGFITAEVLPTIKDNPLVVGLAGVIITAVLAWATPLVRAYGVGSKKVQE
jgi:hypothetical protein